MNYIKNHTYRFMIASLAYISKSGPAYAVDAIWD